MDYAMIATCMGFFLAMIKHGGKVSQMVDDYPPEERFGPFIKAVFTTGDGGMFLLYTVLFFGLFFALLMYG